MVLLNAAGLIFRRVVAPSDPLGEEPLPLRVGERDVVECLQLRAHVRDEVRLIRDVKVLVGLGLQALDELALQLGLGLIG